MAPKMVAAKKKGVDPPGSSGASRSSVERGGPNTVGGSITRNLRSISRSRTETGPSNKRRDAEEEEPMESGDALDQFGLFLAEHFQQLNAAKDKSEFLKELNCIWNAKSDEFKLKYDRKMEIFEKEQEEQFKKIDFGGSPIDFFKQQLEIPKDENAIERFSKLPHEEKEKYLKMSTDHQKIINSIYK